jgi:phage shock protein B
MPIWIFMHYKQRTHQHPAPVAAPSFSQSDAADLAATADRMEQRVAALEAIMDAEAPGWRSKS